MSTRQMAWAATAGRKITFTWLGPAHTLEGYLVGMDDFNWLITSIGSEPQTVLVHKASPDLTVISAEPSLHSEPNHVQDAVYAVGRPFFTFCEENYLGKGK
jgi:hypothetical protein